MSGLTLNLGKALISVTEDRYRIILEFEGGTTVSIGPKAPDSHLEVIAYDMKRGTPEAKAIESGEVSRTPTHSRSYVMLLAKVHPPGSSFPNTRQSRWFAR